ncbi:MAG TPA: peptide chain release factor N(5)-glutamine methyltransferase [Pyrinomonadaceae bacterium]|jgi:release factor glutamine methyltransferase|nr:peptide chain release factor N(5)-glutamine methyltransferase [Pyrinomonadaceae bacterium]
MKDSIAKVLNEAVDALHEASISEPRMEAVSLLMHALNVDRTFVIAHPECELTGDQNHQFRALVRRRATREPLQYITGFQEFFNLTFEVTPDVLIPRPETELIVEAALDLLKQDPAPVIADIGTGSGCIIVSLLHELKGARGVATDKSFAAINVARRNAEHHCVAGRLELIQTDLVSAFSAMGNLSMIVSNPPYVSAGELQNLQPEVRDHEPMQALVSGDDSLSHIRELLRTTPLVLRDGGHFIFEIGFGQVDRVRQLIDDHVWKLVEIRSDLQNIPRTFVLQKR